ncbi:SAM domain (Sterile alpha motif) [Nesidiocoris tenuis]|uniref:SAM domain (Sterile alpha motif) n=1 Tax=Nesidiocoris tenuis TaxID=355587 RepID=A0ABN7AQM5_9HEMI|nr:SAM domain (Sterile alpha motif) [Nesidiocoris tenuis]
MVYFVMTGDRGYLEGLAGRYSEVIGAYNEVLNVLEELRLEEWAQLSPRFRVLNTKVNQQGSLTRQAGLVTSLSQPIYVPGKYSPSSCLSDREEDEIYGFTGYQNAQPQQPIYGACKAPRTPARHPQPQPQLPQQQPYQINKHNYQNWLNPRSAYFYELPPSERPKKRASLIRFLRHLKTGRKDKNASRSNHRVGTPEDGPVNSPLDYDKMRLLQKSSRTITFEETIHRLKVQEAMKKKEKIDRDHEETGKSCGNENAAVPQSFLREIRAGVLVGACSAASGGSRNDDTYMYDEDSARLGQHWYDEPPYESDPEDFLMSDTPPGGPHARLCFAMGGANDQMGVESEVISLRSAGDISLPHHQRAILVPPHSRALRGANRESGDYAASDVNSICSRLSSLSMETSRSEHLEMDLYHRLRPYNGTEPPISPGHSSDYADQEELMGIQPPQASSSSTVQRLRAKCNADMSSSSGKSLGRRHHHHHHHHHHHVHHRHRHPHHSSAESLPSASSTQALVNNMDDYSPQGPALPLARALVDSSPNLYDKEALRFKKGDIIEVMSMSSSGLWRGRAHNRTGHFKFINVELLSGAGVPHHHGLPFLDDDAKSDVSARRSANGLSRPQQQPSTSMENCVSGCANRPTTLEQMLQAIHMEEHMSLFVLNGFEDLESFCEIREEDLDYLGINDPENRAKILAAVQVLQEFEQEEGSWNNDSTNAELSTKEANNFSQQNSTHPLSAGSEKNNMLDEHRPPFLPNIPVISSNCEEPPPLPAPEGGGGMFGGGGQILAGGGTAAATSGDSSSSKGGGGGSEKSSDSGVSSSSGSSSGGRSTTSGGGHRSMGGSRGRPPPPPPPPKPSPPPPPSYVNQIPTVSTPSD